MTPAKLIILKHRAGACTTHHYACECLEYRRLAREEALFLRVAALREALIIEGIRADLIDHFIIDTIPLPD